MSELLLPTVLTLAGRGAVSAGNFLTVLAGTRVTARRSFEHTRTEVANP
ncbi:hypothetical protein QRX60_14450 [Amycolatopsis mongoliensis]|uniref:Uncharacterized protein n=1 Tax=Amycolatopsis mongoliensis TaxID=715475 RepID=A0A9Y2NNY8_9PSEU|nr:hypothetical protein [Amycolatopsis sp. 4-36]WIY04980.1 hypothetical protein QRX60_14450 [Amycolatopsis sp. 4-36]